MALQNLQHVCAATDAGKHTKRASQREVNDNQPGHDHIQDDRQHTRKHTGLIQAHPPHEVNHTTSRDTTTCKASAGTRPHARHQDRQHTRKHTGLTQAHPPHQVLHTTSRDTTTYKASGQAKRTKTYGSHTGRSRHTRWYIQVQPLHNLYFAIFTIMRT